MFPLTKAQRHSNILDTFLRELVWRGSSMVEQWTHKPLDVGSNPTLATLCLTGGRIMNFIPLV